MFRWILLAFVLVPLTELYLLIWLSREIGFWETFAIAVFTGIVGGNMARTEGLRVWRGWNEALSQGRAPEDSLADGMLILVGGALLFTPGVLTDCVGFLLLFPATRHPLSGLLRAALARAVVARTGSPRQSAPAWVATATVVETTGVETTEPKHTVDSPELEPPEPQ